MTRIIGYTPASQVLGDVPSIGTDPAYKRRGEGVLEGQREEVQSRLSFCHAPVMDRIAALAEDG
jgi:hypothetical protein